MDGLVDYLRKDKDIPEVPRSQRYVSRPGLENYSPKLYFKLKALDGKIIEAVEEYGYTQRKVADHLGLYFSSVSRIMSQKSRMQRK